MAYEAPRSPSRTVSVGGRLVTIAPGIAWGTDADVRASTDGYALFRTDAGDAALAAVFGPDRAASLGPAQWRNTLVRTGTARPDARDLRAFTVIRPVTVPVGEAFWARWYFVVGSRTAVLSVLDAYGLVQRAAYGVLRIAPGDSALLSYAVAAAGTAVAVPDVAAARFVLRALPVAGGVPLYRLVRENGTQVLSPSPYALSDPPYNGATARWELLGYAFEAERSTWPRRRLMAGAPMPRARTPRALGVGAARRDRAVGAPSLWCSPRRSSRDAGAAKPRGRRRLRRGRGGRGSLRRTTRPPRSEGCGASPPVPARTRGVKGLPCGHRVEELLSGMLAQSPREGQAAAEAFLRHRGGPCPRQHARTPRYRLDAAWCIIAAMAGDPAQATLSYTAYLALERDTDQRHEWLRGEVWAMAGGSPTHAALAAAILRELGLLALEHGCTAYSSDLKVRVDLTDLSTYPDAAVLCGPVVASPVDALAVTNPTVLVEVLSDSTERYDRGDKWQHYKRLDTLQHYLLVSQRSRHLELFSREAGRWLYTDATEGESLALPGLGGTLSVDRVYRGIALAGDDPR